MEVYMAHNGKLTTSAGWNAIFSWIKALVATKHDAALSVTKDSFVSSVSSGNGEQAGDLKISVTMGQAVKDVS